MDHPRSRRWESCHCNPGHFFFLFFLQGLIWYYFTFAEKLQGWLKGLLYPSPETLIPRFPNGLHWSHLHSDFLSIHRLCVHMFMFISLTYITPTFAL